VHRATTFYDMAPDKEVSSAMVYGKCLLPNTTASRSYLTLPYGLYEADQMVDVPEEQSQEVRGELPQYSRSGGV
jgi:hypothetical protein